MKKFAILLIVLCAVGAAGFAVAHGKNTPKSQPTPVKAITRTPAAPKPVAINHCAGYDPQTVVVSIALRHLWACSKQISAYDSAVVTGYEGDPSTLTPPGTYTVYSKVTNTVLNGSDVNGTWHDPVAYWMPWLHNKYGTYGFHDASWRDPSAFGNIDQNTKDASHGCVELPTPTAAWLYNWVQIGTSVVIQA